MTERIKIQEKPEVVDNQPGCRGLKISCIKVDLSRIPPDCKVVATVCRGREAFVRESPILGLRFDAMGTYVPLPEIRSVDPAADCRVVIEAVDPDGKTVAKTGCTVDIMGTDFVSGSDRAESFRARFAYDDIVYREYTGQNNILGGFDPGAGTGIDAVDDAADFLERDFEILGGFGTCGQAGGGGKPLFVGNLLDNFNAKELNIHQRLGLALNLCTVYGLCTGFCFDDDSAYLGIAVFRSIGRDCPLDPFVSEFAIGDGPIRSWLILDMGVGDSLVASAASGYSRIAEFGAMEALDTQVSDFEAEASAVMEGC